MSNVVNVVVERGVAVITIDSPPVNALNVTICRALTESFRELAANSTVGAVVLMCAGRTFIAGADIAEFGQVRNGPGLDEVFDIIESGSVPVIAAIHGTALGAGLELALTCHYRIAVSAAKIGLPEVKLGILPGAGGTQRLPRIIGAELALDLMTSGRQIGAEAARDMGILDAIVHEGHLRESALSYARSLATSGRRPMRVRDREDKIAADRQQPTLFSDFRNRHARGFRGLQAPEAIIQAVEAAVTLPFERGLAREAELLKQLVSSPQSAAQRYIFFAERAAAKVPDLPVNCASFPIAGIGVVGAGTMGVGIAMSLLAAGIPVTLVEMNQEALDRGVAVLRASYERAVQRGRMAVAEVERRTRLITPTLELGMLATVDLVIEAVYESIEVKKDVFARLDRIAKPGAILASNTSFLNLDEIAAATSRPDFVIGMHFFSPADVMRLLEVVMGARTAPPVISTVMKLAKQIGKIPVLSRVGPGFIANRVMTPRSQRATDVLLEGSTPEVIDRVVCDYGFPMGPFQMVDLVGLDVIGRDTQRRTLNGDLVAAGRLGQKKNGGFYDYDGNRNATPSVVAQQIIARFAADTGIARRKPQSNEDILARLLYPVVNEGVKILAEGIATRASDIDVAAIYGFNWPIYTGGPMFWGDVVGLKRIVAKLNQFASESGSEAYRASPLLVQLAEEGRSLHTFGTA